MIFGPLAQWHPLRRRAVGVLAALALACVAPAQAREWLPSTGSVAVAQLPQEAQAVYAAIHAGGPFPHAKDGSVFGNRERLLPPRSRGFYREYTVATPRARDRGPRRIVCGGQERVAPAVCYYTPDHYSSFQKISP